jgi:hypothetical protein
MNITRSALLIPLLLGCSFFESGMVFEHRAVVLVANIDAGDWPADAIAVDSLTTTFAGPLRAYVTYGGGCGKNRVALIVETSFAESAPPVLRARLAHDAGPYQCKALLREAIDFDLAIVRDHFHAAYPFSLGEFALDVKGAPRVTHYFP